MVRLTDEEMNRARHVLDKEGGFTEQEIDHMLSSKKSILNTIQLGFILLNAVFVIHILMKARP